MNEYNKYKYYKFHCQLSTANYTKFCTKIDRILKNMKRITKYIKKFEGWKERNTNEL